MRKQLLGDFLKYVRANHPEILDDFDNDGLLMDWLNAKLELVMPTIQALKKKYRPEPQIVEVCMAELTTSLGPSRLNYIRHLLEEEFEVDHTRMAQAGILHFEAFNMLNRCRSTFDDLRFSAENEDNRFTRYAITGVLKEYLEEQRGSENVSDGVQQPAEAAG